MILIFCYLFFQWRLNNSEDGKIKINPSLLRKEEFLQKEEIFPYLDKNDVAQKISLKEGSFAITYCQISFIFQLSYQNNIIVYKSNGDKIVFENLGIDEQISQSIFNYGSDVIKVEVFFDRNSFDGI
jgi:hypothetical protein